VFVRGAEPEFAQILPLFNVASGRFISRYDEDHALPVVVLGYAIAGSLFPLGDSLGKMVRVNGKLFEVVGVFAHDTGLSFGPGVDQFVIMPLSQFHKQYPEIKELAIAFNVRRDVDLQAALDQVTESTRRRRKVPHNAENDFELFSPDFISSLWNQLTGAIVLLTGVISSVGLLVGGVGVMNIMLISVTERTMEIGVRKAIGARRADIRVQFLLEALMLTITGGVIGILAGAGIAWGIRTVLPALPAEVSSLWVTLGVAMSVGVGLFFGYWPASRAARLDPVVCLRYE
jgi:putative ABC transport system permease protein